MAKINIPIDEKLRLWAEGVYRNIRANFETQRVFPFKPYPDSPESSGSLYNSLYFKVSNAAGGDTTKIDFFFNYYGLFVDLGVGRGQKYAQVDNAAPSVYGKRYKEWKKKGDRQSRPILLREFRQEIRMLRAALASRYELKAIYTLARLNPEKETAGTITPTGQLI